MKYYYIFIMAFSSGLMGLFVDLGANGVLSPFPTLTGIILSIAGAIGAGIDMYHKSK
jgi:hypothetical protein